MSGVFHVDLPKLPSLIPQGLEDGRVRNLLALEPADFQIKPVSRRLAQINRYGGALPWPYAVTTHSLLVARLLRGRQAEYAGLMHDITEAFGIGDLIAPLKRLHGFEAYNEIELQIRTQLAGPFGLSIEESPEVRRADERAYQLECMYMKKAWPRPEHTRFEPWYPSDSEHEACLFYLRQEFAWRDSARLFVEAFSRLAPEAVKERCL